MNNFTLINFYAIIYGIYENNVVFRNLYLLQYITLYGNWTIMWSILFVIFILFKFDFIDCMYYVLYFGMTEDIVFWISDSFYKKKFPFPVGNWYDEKIPYFKQFNLGEASVFEPRVPYFYYVFIIICTVYFILRRLQYNLLTRIWNLLSLVPMYTMIIGSIVIPENIINKNGYLILISIQILFYILGICYYILYKRTGSYRRMQSNSEIITV